MLEKIELKSLEEHKIELKSLEEHTWMSQANIRMQKYVNCRPTIFYNKTQMFAKFQKKRE